jgi:hypothetical protein
MEDLVSQSLEKFSEARESHLLLMRVEDALGHVISIGSSWPQPAHMLPSLGLKGSPAQIPPLLVVMPPLPLLLGDGELVDDVFAIVALG